MKVTTLLFYILLLMLPLGNLTRLSFGTIALTVNDLVLPLLIVAWLAHQFIIVKKVYLPTRSGILFLFSTWAFITLLSGLRYIDTQQFLVSFLYWFRWMEYGTLFILVYNLVISNRGTLQEDNTATQVTLPAQADNYQSPITNIESFSLKILKLLLFGQLVFVLFGFAQYILFPDFSKFVQHGWDPHFYRLLSTFLDPNFAGIFIILGMIVCGSFLLVGGKELYKRKLFTLFLIFLLVVSAVAVLLTFSRSSYLALMVAAGILGMIRSRKMLFVFGVIALASFLFIPRVQERVIGAVTLDETARLRLESYEKTWQIIEDNIWFGVGFNTFRYAQDREGFFQDDRGVNFPEGHAGAGADSSILFLLATTGIVGFFLYIVLWGTFVFDSFNVYRNKNLPWISRVLGLTFFTSNLVLMVNSQFVNSLFLIWIMEWMWITGGLMYGLKQVQD